MKAGPQMGVYSARIHSKLTAAFPPTRLDVVDDSNSHAGHAGAHPDGSGETHFNVAMESQAFAGKGRVERQRLVHQVLADELKERVHALSLKLSAPGEG
jgi:BolA family transcriptional regulator, general stress-responsive regulator